MVIPEVRSLSGVGGGLCVQQLHNAAAKYARKRFNTNSEFSSCCSLCSAFTKRCTNYNLAPEKKKTAFSSSAPDLLRPLMQIESIAIFQLEYLRRNRSPTCHSRVLKTTEDADDRGERRSCARARDVSGAARSFKCIYGSIQDPSSSSLFHQAVIRSFTNLLVLLISSTDIWTKKNAP